VQPDASNEGEEIGVLISGVVDEWVDGEATKLNMGEPRPE